MVKQIIKKFSRRRRISESEITPDDIFLDAHNLPDFDVSQMEGRMEKPISKNPIKVFGVVMIFVLIGFIIQLWTLQGVSGERFAIRAESNRLRQTLVFAERGLVYDRRDAPLIWNTVNATSTDFSLRKYNELPGLSHVLGYIKYPSKDSGGFYYREEMEGVSGVESYFNNNLAGTNGQKIVETDSLGKVQSESVINPPQHGDTLKLSVDAELQSKMYEYIQGLSEQVGFTGGAGVIMNIHTGEVLALTSYPEYSSQVMTDGTDRKAIVAYNANTSYPFLDKVISGLYTPGSIVKPFMGVAALETGVISAEKQILGTASISIPNPYAPGQATVFKDWRTQGWVDLRKAIAVSSDVYFYEVGGGYQDQKGMGIEAIDRYMKLFGFGTDINSDFFKDKKGVIPTPEWKAENFDGDGWRVGNTYHTAIGQYGFQVTPIQAVRAVASLANGGNIVEPSILMATTSAPVPMTKIPVTDYSLRVVGEGMRQGVTSGILTALNVPYVDIAAKSGTAELGVSKQLVNSWITGFFPYENPQYAFTVVMEKGKATNLTGAVFVMRNLFDWMRDNRPEYLK